MDIKKECYRIYCDEFGEDDFSERLFSLCFKYCRWIECDGKPVAILFLLPCNIILNNNPYTAKYVFAVTTAKEYRGNGYMQTLLKQVAETDDILFLKPANEELISYYEKSGYKAFTAVNSRIGEKQVVLEKDFAALAEGYSKADWTSYTAMYYSNKNPDLNGLAFADTLE